MYGLLGATISGSREEERPSQGVPHLSAPAFALVISFSSIGIQLCERPAAEVVQYAQGHSIVRDIMRGNRLKGKGMTPMAEASFVWSLT